MSEIDTAINEAQKLSFQDRADSEIMYGRNIFPVLSGLASANHIIAPWWSNRRDVQLREFWKKPDHLAGATYAMESKMTAIPVQVVARDTSINKHVEQAKIYTELLNDSAEFGRGWVIFYGKWIEDLLTQDNGAFAEVIGSGNPAGPIIGRAVSLAHLDSYRCQRTGNTEYPVLYLDTDGTRYKVHRTRVVEASQMTSPIAEMFGVGFCAVSRVINVSQNLLDILIYKQEKLGSRPLRELIITKGGLDPKDLQFAFRMAESEMDSFGLSRYSKIVIGGSATLPEGSVEQVPLSYLPDGFDEETSITLGMATIALGFGTDARELFPSKGGASTRADALVQHLKQRGKGPGQMLQVTEQQLNHKFLPPYLKMKFDFQDDAEDRQKAEIRTERAKRRVHDLETGAMTKRTLREQMVEDSDITQDQFERMEMLDGRLPDGTPVLSLFYSNSRDYKQYLDLGVADPLDIDGNDTEKMFTAIKEQRRELLSDMQNKQWGEPNKITARLALSALNLLEMRYRQPEFWLTWQDMEDKPAPVNMELDEEGNYVDPRSRTQDTMTPKDDDAGSKDESHEAKKTQVSG